MKSCRMSLDWSYKGYKALILENRFLKVTCLPGKGSDIIEIIYKPLDMNLLWNFELSNIDKEYTISNLSTSSSSFLDFYMGGWQDILPSIGFGPVNYRGSEFGLHGETSNLVWNCEIIENSKDRVTSKLTVTGKRYPYRVEKWLSLEENSSILKIRERLTNLANHELEFTWLQHPTFGEPFLDEGSILDIPAEEVITDGKLTLFYGTKEGKYKWPKVIDTEGKERDLSVIPSKNLIFHDFVVISSFNEGWYALTNRKLKVGFGLRWDKKVYPYLWFWQNYNTPNYPWFGRAWNIGLEPSTSIAYTGLSDQVKEGKYIRLNSKESIETEILAIIYTNLKRVNEIDKEGKVEGEKA